MTVFRLSECLCVDLIVIIFSHDEASRSVVGGMVRMDLLGAKYAVYAALFDKRKDRKEVIAKASPGTFLLVLQSKDHKKSGKS